MSAASLIASLTISGSRKSDGTPNASGLVYAYLPETTTTVQLYSDPEATTVVTQPLVLDEAGRVNPSDYPDGVFTAVPIRLVIQDADGLTVSDSLFTPATAGDTSVSNAGFTGTDMNAVLTAALTSFGGADWKYKPTAGATARTIKSKISDFGYSPRDFGGVGDGVAVDTTAVQAALNAVIADGGGVVDLGPYSYKIDQAIVATNATGVTIRGVRGVTTVTLTNATANAFTFATASTSCSIEGVIIAHSGTSTGAAISVAAGQNFAIRDVTTVDDFAYGADFSGISNWFIQNSFLFGNTRGVRSNISAGNYPSILFNSQVGNTSAVGIELNGTGGNYTFVGGILWGTSGVSVGGSYTGGPLNIFGTRNLGTTPFNMGGSNLGTRWWGAGIDGYTTSQDSGGGSGSAFSPDMYKGQEIHLRLTSGGAAVVTINAPTPVPATTAAMRNLRLTLKITAAAGGAITARFNANYILVGGGTDIVVADGNTEVVEFLWDVQTEEWRECFRSVTTT